MKTGDLARSMWKDAFVFELDDKLRKGGRMIPGCGPLIYFGDIGGSPHNHPSSQRRASVCKGLRARGNQMRVGDLLVNSGHGYIELRCDGEWDATDSDDAEDLFFICLGEISVEGVSMVWVLVSRRGVTRISKSDLRAA